MINKITLLPQQRVERIVSHLERHKNRLKPDVSNYSKGRMRYWLNHEWDLKSRKFSPGVQDPRLWTFCKELMPEADLGLVAYGSIGIGPHRDDSYADWRAIGINLGDLEAWHYDCQYPEFKWTRDRNPSNPQNYEIRIGHVFEFNCKNPHAAINPKENRWAIFLWKISQKFRTQFQHETS